MWPRSPLKCAKDSSATDARNIAQTSGLDWGQASTQELKRFLVDADGAQQGLLERMDGSVSQCEVRQAFNKAPRSPVATRFALQWDLAPRPLFRRKWNLARVGLQWDDSGRPSLPGLRQSLARNGHVSEALF